MIAATVGHLVMLRLLSDHIGRGVGTWGATVICVAGDASACCSLRTRVHAASAVDLHGWKLRTQAKARCVVDLEPKIQVSYVGGDCLHALVRRYVPQGPAFGTAIAPLREHATGAADATNGDHDAGTSPLELPFIDTRHVIDHHLSQRTHQCRPAQ